MLPVPAAFLLSSLATQVPFHVGEPDDDARDALYVFTCMRALSLLNGPGTPLYDLPQAIHDADLGSSGGAERPWMFPLVVRGADRHAVVVDVAAGYTADELVESGRKAAQRLAGITIAELAAPDASSPGLEPDVAMSRLLLLGGPTLFPARCP